MTTTIASTNTAGNHQIRTYCRSNSAVFLKTKEKHGGLSNMAGGFPLVVNGVDIRTSEALYQACRFPHMPDVQHSIIEQRSPMTAKMKGKPHRHNSRSDWDAVRVKIMRWCLEVKLAQNWDSFSELLLETGNLPIVEHSRRDDFWGAKPVGDQTLVGINVLGRLLMQLRERVKLEPSETLLRVEPLSIPDFLLYRSPIGTICQLTPNENLGQSHIAEDTHPTYERLTQIPLLDAPPPIVAEPASSYSAIDGYSHLININTSTVKELEVLPSIGPRRSQNILAYREKNGRFQIESDIINVHGIDKKIYKSIADLITTGSNPKLLIPV